MQISLPPPKTGFFVDFFCATLVILYSIHSTVVGSSVHLYTYFFVYRFVYGIYVYVSTTKNLSLSIPFRTILFRMVSKQVANRQKVKKRNFEMKFFLVTRKVK